MYTHVLKDQEKLNKVKTSSHGEISIGREAACLSVDLDLFYKLTCKKETTGIKNEVYQHTDEK